MAAKKAKQPSASGQKFAKRGRPTTKREISASGRHQLARYIAVLKWAIAAREAHVRQVEFWQKTAEEAGKADSSRLTSLSDRCGGVAASSPAYDEIAQLGLGTHLVERFLAEGLSQVQARQAAALQATLVMFGVFRTQHAEEELEAFDAALLHCASTGRSPLAVLAARLGLSKPTDVEGIALDDLEALIEADCRLLPSASLLHARDRSIRWAVAAVIAWRRSPEDDSLRERAIAGARFASRLTTDQVGQSPLAELLVPKDDEQRARESAEWTREFDRAANGVSARAARAGEEKWGGIAAEATAIIGILTGLSETTISEAFYKFTHETKSLAGMLRELRKDQKARRK